MQKCSGAGKARCSEFSRGVDGVGNLLVGLHMRRACACMFLQVMVELDGQTDPLEIAHLELAQKKRPFTIRRYMPDGSYEDWSVNELEIPDR